MNFDASYRSELHDDPIVGPIVGQFVRNLPMRVAALRAALHQSDWREVLTLAHQLAGSSGSYGFPKMGMVAAEIEVQAKDQVSPLVLAESIERFSSLCDAAARGNSQVH